MPMKISLEERVEAATRKVAGLCRERDVLKASERGLQQRIRALEIENADLREKLVAFGRPVGTPKEKGTPRVHSEPYRVVIETSDSTITIAGAYVVSTGSTGTQVVVCPDGAFKEGAR